MYIYPTEILTFSLTLLKGKTTKKIILTYMLIQVKEIICMTLLIGRSGLFLLDEKTMYPADILRNIRLIS